MFFNVRVYAILQTYIGFKIIKSHFQEYKEQNKCKSFNEYGKCYNLLRAKYF